MKCQRITDVLDCMQWYPKDDARHVSNDRVRMAKDGPYVVNASNHVIKIKPGDWVVNEWGNGDRAFVVDPDTFARTYKMIPEPVVS